MPDMPAPMMMASKSSSAAVSASAWCFCVAVIFYYFSCLQICRLLRLDPRIATNANPFFDVGMHQLRKLLRTVAGGLNTLLAQQFLHFRRFQRREDGRIELVDDRSRRIGRRQYTV